MFYVSMIFCEPSIPLSSSEPMVLISTIGSELESGIDGSLNAILDVMKSFGAIGPRSLAEKSESEFTVADDFYETDGVNDLFLKLFAAVGDILKTSRCTFLELRSACIKTDIPLVKVNSLPSELKDKINATTNMDELLAVLIESSYCNWINVRILEKMAALSLQRKAQILIAKYKKVIFSKKLTDVLQYFPDLKITDEYYAKVYSKWGKDFQDITVKDITDHWSKLQKIFDVDDFELLIENVIKGSIEIVWLIPAELASQARFSAFKNWCDLEDVSYLSIGGHVIKNEQLEFADEHIYITKGILT